MAVEGSYQSISEPFRAATEGGRVSVLHLHKVTVITNMKEFILTVYNFLAVIEAQERQAEKSIVVLRVNLSTCFLCFNDCKKIVYN